MRFVRKIALLVVVLFVSIWVFRETAGWHRASLVDHGSALARQLRETPVPDDPLAIYYGVDAFRSLGLQDEAQALSHYVARQLLLRALGEPPERAATVGAALQQEMRGGDSLNALRKRFLASSLRVSLPQLPGTAPAPKLQHAPPNPYKVSLVLANGLNAAITHFDLSIAVDNTAGGIGNAMVDLKIRCVNGYMSSIAQGQDITTECTADSASTAAQMRELADTLDKVRAGTLMLSAVPVRIFIRTDGAEVTAMLVSKTDLSFSGPSWENSKGRVLVLESPCEQRGDCTAIMKRKASEYTGYLQYAIMIISGMIFGTLFRGFIALVTVPGQFRNVLSAAVLLLSFGLIPFVSLYGGSGLGMLFAPYYSAISLFGFALGFAAEAYAQRNPSK